MPRDQKTPAKFDVGAPRPPQHTFVWVNPLLTSRKVDRGLENFRSTVLAVVVLLLIVYFLQPPGAATTGPPTADTLALATDIATPTFLLGLFLLGLVARNHRRRR